MPAIKIQMLGLPEMQGAFNSLSEKMRGQFVMAGLVAGAMHVRNKAADLCPKLTRTLMRSIHIGGYSNLTPGFSSGEGYSDIGGNEVMEDRAKVEVGTNLIYAGPQEYGATICARNMPYLHFRTDDGQWHKVRCVTIPPHPYLRPAFDLEFDNVGKEVDHVVGKLIKDAGF